jgi:hypothetical protein
MSAIRPDLPAVQPPSQGSSSLRQAQAAFFRAALNDVQGTQAQTTQVRTTPVQPRTAEPPSSPAGRSMRPGSLLDIKV